LYRLQVMIVAKGLRSLDIGHHFPVSVQNAIDDGLAVNGFGKGFADAAVLEGILPIGACNLQRGLLRRVEHEVADVVGWRRRHLEPFVALDAVHRLWRRPLNDLEVSGQKGCRPARSVLDWRKRHGLPGWRLTPIV